MYKYNQCSSPSSVSLRGRGRFRSTICCFRNYPIESMVEEDEGRSSTPRSPYTWLKSTAHELEIKDRCRSLISRIGVAKGQGRKHHGSTEFSYDPMSYALNFEDDRVDDELPLSFSSRLPATPERLPEPKGLH